MKNPVLAALLLIILLPIDVYAYKENIHESSNRQAIINSNIISYLNNYLGLKISTKIKTKIRGGHYLENNIGEWITNGGKWEDDDIRFKNHFYDPTTAEGLNGIGYYFESSFSWAGYDSGNTWNWKAAKNYFYQSLVATNMLEREENLANTFRAVGQVMHLVEDLAAPAHVRNDIHLPVNRQKDLYEEFTNSKAIPKKGELPIILYTGYPSVNLQTFSQVEAFWRNNGKGLAEFTNKNFLSRNTNVADNKYPSPVPVGEWVIKETITDSKGRKHTEDVKYLQGYVTDSYQPDKSGPISRLAAFSYFDDEMKKRNNQRAYSLNDSVHAEYAQFLVPRAVGYAAGLLNYFFRGAIELNLPDRGVYAVATPGGSFREIRVKAKNVTSTNEDMSNGLVQLVVKYKLALTDPFQSAQVNTSPEFSYVVVPEKNGIKSIPKAASIELVFDLSATPIPLWATDVYLQVVYKGSLGSETDAVAVGFKDISEPTPVDVFNNTDYVCLGNSWYVSGSRAALTKADTNKDGKADTDIYAHAISNIAFQSGPIGTTAPLVASAQQNNLFYSSALSPGQFRRLGYTLTDYSLRYTFDETWINLSNKDSFVLDLSTAVFPGQGFVNQADKGYGEMYSMRGIKMWWGTGVVYDNPAYPATSSCQWEQLPVP